MTATGGLPDLPHFAPRAKRAICLFMNEGPSQMDLWDYKPKLAEQFDKDLPDSIRKGQRLTTMTSGQSRFPIGPRSRNEGFMEQPSPLIRMLKTSPRSRV